MVAFQKLLADVRQAEESRIREGRVTDDVIRRVWLVSQPRVRRHGVTCQANMVSAPVMILVAQGNVRTTTVILNILNTSTCFALCLRLDGRPVGHVVTGNIASQDYITPLRRL